jgi:cytochrome bd-type quinol oxidase subunit 2
MAISRKTKPLCFLIIGISILAFAFFILIYQSAFFSDTARLGSKLVSWHDSAYFLSSLVSLSFSVIIALKNRDRKILAILLFCACLFSILFAVLGIADQFRCSLSSMMPYIIPSILMVCASFIITKSKEKSVQTLNHIRH